MVDWNGERRAFVSRFLTPEPLSCGHRFHAASDADKVMSGWRAGRCRTACRTLVCGGERVVRRPTPVGEAVSHDGFPWFWVREEADIPPLSGIAAPRRSSGEF